ncbi:MAG: hypothetical protein AAF639_42655 [Chloroflexota bacterium]
MPNKLFRTVKENLPLAQNLSKNISAKDISARDVLIVGGLVVGAALWVGFSHRVLPKLLRPSDKEQKESPQSESSAYQTEPTPESSNSGTDAETQKHLTFYRYANLIPDHTDAYFLARRNDILVTGLVLWGGFGLLMWPQTRSYIARHHVGTATPGTLGAIRIVVCLVAAYMAYDEPIEEVASWIGVRRRTMGVMAWLYRLPMFERVTTDAVYAARFKALTIMMLMVAAAGYQTRITLPIATTLYLATHGIVRSYTYLNHAGMTALYALAVLCCVRSADAYSIDRLLGDYQGTTNHLTNEPQAHYAWARLAIWITIAFPYVQAGLSKVRFGSWHWWESVNLRSILFRYRLSWAEVVEESIPKQLVMLPDLFYSAIGLSTILIEISMALVPFSQQARRMMPLATVGMHIGILGFMGIEFWDMLILQGIFYDWGTAHQGLLPTNSLSPDEPTKAVHNDAPMTTHWLPPLWTFLLVAFYLISWALRIEFYPITASQIFIKHSKNSVIHYVKVYKTDVYGQRSPAYLWEMGRPSRDHGGYLMRHFGLAEEYTYISDVLRQIGERWNTHAKPEERITQLEFVLFEWDFVADREACRGKVVKRLAVKLDL